MITTETISHRGSKFTITDFKTKGGDTIRVRVYFENSMPQIGTYYTFQIETKGHRCRNFDYQFTSENSKDERYKMFITPQQLYKAFFNHWSKLNPFRMFSNGQTNGDLVNFTVKEEEYNFEHKAY